jgi:hypothetical protein
MTPSMQSNYSKMEDRHVSWGPVKSQCNIRGAENYEESTLQAHVKFHHSLRWNPFVFSDTLDPNMSSSPVRGSYSTVGETFEGSQLLEAYGTIDMLQARSESSARDYDRLQGQFQELRVGVAGMTQEHNKQIAIMRAESQRDGVEHDALKDDYEQLAVKFDALNADYNELKLAIDDRIRVHLLQLSIGGVDLSSWNTGFPSVGWRGVSCAGQFITKIDLHSTQGTGSPELTCLPSSLEYLSLYNGQFSGSLNLTQLPLTLTQLYLYGNKFSGSVDLTQLPPALAHLYLCDNQLSGEVDLAHLPATLTRLELQCNKFTAVNVATNALRSSLPSTIYLSNNSWTRPLPRDPTWLVALM